MPRLLKKIWPFTIIIAVTCLIFFKVFTKGLFPAPADLLVSFYFPFYSGGWEGYNPFTTHKELLNADAVRQIYPWKELATNILKSGTTPLWNPYTFSGQPLMANLQTGAFYPLNLLYLLFDARLSWIILVITQPLLAGLFMFLALKSLKISDIASVFASTAFMFTSYLVTWMENVNVGHSYIWIPLTIYAINKFFETNKTRYIILGTASLTLSILAGHPQTSIYAFIFISIFYLYKVHSTQNNKNILYLPPLLLMPLMLSSIQLIPSLAFYRASPVSLPFSAEVFDKTIIPAKNLITFFASDFFGHPANNNFWSFSYGDFTPYIGVVPLLLFAWGIANFNHRKEIIFFATVAITFILASTQGPLTYLIKTFKIPILDSTTPSRFISISIMAMIVITALSLDDLLKNIGNKKYLKRFLTLLTFLGVVYILLWLFAFSAHNILTPKDEWIKRLSVTKRNLILPTLTYALFFSAVFSNYYVKIGSKIKKTILLSVSFFVLLVGGIYYTNKFLPFAPLNYIFPDHPLFSWLEENAGIYRFHGSGTARLDYNLPIHYKVYGAEGYDTLRLARYAQLMASSKDGVVPEKYLRSDATFPPEENGHRRRLFELMGVKYLIDKEDGPKTGSDWHESKFAPDEVKGSWQQGNIQVYERKNVLPRIFLTNDYKVAINDEEIIKSIYDFNYPLTKLILEEEPSLDIVGKSDVTIPHLEKYDTNSIIINTSASSNSILFMSDAYADGWKATVDGHPTKILRAHYTFRAVAVPKGEHVIMFNYNPEPFKKGLYATVAAVILIVTFCVVSFKNKRF